MSTTQTLKEQRPAPQQVVTGGEIAGTSGSFLRQNLWQRFAPGVVAVVLTAGLSVFGWLLANQIADTEQDINRIETQLIRVETNLREDMAQLETRLSADIDRVESRIARVESKLDSQIARMDSQIARVESKLAGVESKLDSLIASLIPNPSTAVN